MPDMNGLELLRRVRAEYSQMKVLILSMHAEEQYAVRAFKAGANGYVTKDSAARELAAAVRKVAGGGAYVSDVLAESLVLHLNGARDTPAHAHLSDRELEVLRRLVAGERLLLPEQGAERGPRCQQDAEKSQHHPAVHPVLVQPERRRAGPGGEQVDRDGGHRHGQPDADDLQHLSLIHI